MIDHTHDPAATSWVAGADSHADFPVQNLPLGVMRAANGGGDGAGAARIVTAIGDQVLDLHALAQVGMLPESLRAALMQQRLNALFALPEAQRRALRHTLFALLVDPAQAEAISPYLRPASGISMLCPFAIGDYTDFYVGIHHATNIGRLFRPDNPLLPNYRHVPIAYHGRASSVRVSGTPVIRPSGQIKAPDTAEPSYAPTRRLDCELELGVWIAGDSALGDPIPIARAWDRIGGLSLLNDWSARDIQAWEYQPLGPFLSKNFLTTVSPWVVTSQALAPFRIAPPPRPAQDPAPLPYLRDEGDRQSGGLSIDLSISLSTAAMREAGIGPHTLSRGEAAQAMYWTPAQMVAHHASGGCDLHSGDLLGTGTLSGPDRGSEGSLIEMTQGGKAVLSLPGGETRGFLEDGDELVLSATARRTGFRSIGFGPCAGRVAPAVGGRDADRKEQVHGLRG